MSETIQSRPYEPQAQACCEACCFGRSEHAEWCPVGNALVSAGWSHSGPFLAGEIITFGEGLPLEAGRYEFRDGQLQRIEC